jgi:hypothetical protein
MDKLKSNPVRLSKYVIDYADCSTLTLDRLGIYRYRILNTCVLGQESPKHFLRLMSAYNDSFFFYCNERSQSIDAKEIERAYAHPDQYAIVLYYCFQ